jgi:hypothetical protein
VRPLGLNERVSSGRALFAAHPNRTHTRRAPTQPVAKRPCGVASNSGTDYLFGGAFGVHAFRPAVLWAGLSGEHENFCIQAAMRAPRVCYNLMADHDAEGSDVTRRGA